MRKRRSIRAPLLEERRLALMGDGPEVEPDAEAAIEAEESEDGATWGRTAN
jgi:hypothetical protein